MIAHVVLSYIDNDDTEETQEFILNFDCFFDFFNVLCISEAVHKQKPDLRPY